MSGKSKTTRRAVNAGRAQRQDTAPKLVALVDAIDGTHERVNPTGTPGSRCGWRSLLPWRYGVAEDITCEECKSARDAA